MGPRRGGSPRRRLGAGLGGLVLLAAMAARAAPVAPAPTPGAPCTSATALCQEWMPLGSGKARAIVYRSYGLRAPNPRVRRALVMIHGALRNGDHYFTTATTAAFMAGALHDTVVIAPAFRSAQGECNDKLEPGEVSWSCEGDSWRSGGRAASDPGLTSFDFMDEILRRLADKRVFPNLKRIVVAGHSAGGQFVSRYEMANTVHESLGVPVSYVVANPSSYAWPDASRVLPTGDAAPDAAKASWGSEAVHTRFTYGPFQGTAASSKYNLWPYGLEQRGAGYASTLSDDQLKAQLARRPTTYLFGQVDTLPLGGFDDTPPAMAQGPTRRARGEAFVKYIAEHLGAHPAAMIVPECGHNDRCVFTTDSVLPVLFPPLP